MFQVKINNIISKLQLSSNKIRLVRFTCKKCPNEPTQIDKTQILDEQKLKSRLRLEQNSICVKGQSILTAINDIPTDVLCSKRVRIFQPPKNVMQSGTFNTNTWAIDFNRGLQWENALVGWCSSNDVLSGVRVFFKNKDDAIAFCEKQGWKWWVHETWKEKPFKPKNYAANFLWNKRSRVSTK